MTCEDVREMIALYYYGELEDTAAGAVRNHLASCAHCGEDLARVRAVLEAVTPPDVPDLPEEFWRHSTADIMRRLRRPSAEIIPSRRILPRFAVGLWAAAAAAVMLFLFVCDTGSRREPDDSVVVGAGAEAADDVEAAIEIACLETEVGMDGFWDRVPSEASGGTAGDFDSKFEETLDTLMSSCDAASSGTSSGFDSGFRETLDTIEDSIDILLMEFEIAGPWGIGANGSA